MQDLLRYLKDIVEPTIKDFEHNPTSERHAFLACVATFHAVDYLAFPDKARGLRQKFGRKSEDFKVVDEVAHAFKHVRAGDPAKPSLTAKEVVSRRGVFQPGVFQPDAFDVGAVTLEDKPEVNLLRTVKGAVKFLRALEVLDNR